MGAVPRSTTETRLHVFIPARHRRVSRYLGPNEGCSFSPSPPCVALPSFSVLSSLLSLAPDRGNGRTVTKSRATKAARTYSLVLTTHAHARHNDPNSHKLEPSIQVIRMIFHGYGYRRCVARDQTTEYTAYETHYLHTYRIFYTRHVCIGIRP